MYKQQNSKQTNEPINVQKEKGMKKGQRNILSRCKRPHSGTFDRCRKTV